MAQTIKTFFDLGGAKRIADPRVAEQQRQQQLAIEDQRRQDALRAALAGEGLQREKLIADQQRSMAQFGMDQQRLGLDRDKFDFGKQEAGAGREHDMLLEQLRQSGLDTRQAAGFDHASGMAQDQRGFLQGEGALDRAQREEDALRKDALQRYLDEQAGSRWQLGQESTERRANEARDFADSQRKQKAQEDWERAKWSEKQRQSEGVLGREHSEKLAGIRNKPALERNAAILRQETAQAKAAKDAQKLADLEAIKPYVGKLIEEESISQLELSLLTPSQRDLFLERFAIPNNEQQKSDPQTFLDNFGDGRTTSSPLDVLRNPNASKEYLGGGDPLLGNQEFDPDMLRRILRQKR